MTEHPVVYVDLIEDRPKTREEFREWSFEPANFDAGIQSVAEIDREYQNYLDRFQPFRWHSTSEGNHEVLGQGERYFNEAGALHNIGLQFAEGSIVYLRRPEHGNECIRMAYPNDLGEVILLGPNIQVTADGSVINWNGVNYVPQVVPDE